MGPAGLREVAELCLQKSHYAAGRLAERGGWPLRFDRPFFKEFVVKTPGGNMDRRVQEGVDAGYFIGLPLGRWYPELSDALLVTVTEKRTRAEIDGLAELAGRLNGS